MLPLVELIYMTTYKLQLYELFSLGFATHNSHAYDFEILLKGFRSSVVDLVVATRFHQHLIIDLETCGVRRL